MQGPLALPLPPFVNRLLHAWGATRERPAAEPDLHAVLAAHGYEVTDAVRAFERDFGGLVVRIPEEDSWLIGPAACVGSAAHAAPRGGPDQAALGLVPVVYTADDMIGYLDRDGRGWFHDTLEAEAAACVAPDGPRMLASLIAWKALHARTPRQLPGARGAEVAGALGLPRLEPIGDARERWWGDDDVLVVERGDVTWVAGPADRLAPLG